jgi:hypothetical protein
MRRTSRWTFPSSIVAAALLAAACGGGGGAMTLRPKYPDEPAQRHHKIGKTVLVRVTDAREFSAQPGPISVPTYAGEKPPDGELARTIGARSGEGGKNFSNIVLADPLTVKSIVKQLAEISFEFAGFTVVGTAEEAEGGPDYVAEVSAASFWVWMTPGGLTIAVNSNVEAEISLQPKDGAPVALSARGYHEDVDVGNSIDSYNLALNEALNNFLVDLEKACLAYADSLSPDEGEDEGGGT